MRLLITGELSPRTGSWMIRGAQLGAAVGATTVAPRLSWSTAALAHDVCVVVKRPAPDFVRSCRKAGVPLVWDVVDPWPQPQGNYWSRTQALDWLRTRLGEVRPTLAIAATAAMAKDIESLGWPAVFVPHHSRPGLPVAPVREVVKTVGYEGSVVHLGEWADIVVHECESRGWSFVVNGPYTECDIILGLREADGYTARAWKSCVKLANAQAAGLPFIGSPEAGYLEVRVPGCERFVTYEAHLRAAFDVLAPLKERLRVTQWMRSASQALTLSHVATRYRAAVESVAR